MAVASAKYYFLPYLSLKAQAAYKMQLEDKDTFNKKIQYNATYSQGTTYKEVTNTNYDRISADILPEFKKSFGQHNVNVYYPTISTMTLDKVGIEKLRVYYSGQNLFTLSGMLKGWDPEAPSGRGNGFPQTMVNSIGLNVTF